MQRYNISDLSNPEKGLVIPLYPGIMKSARKLNSERKKRLKKYRRAPMLRFKHSDCELFVKMDSKTMLFNCPMCRNVLRGPITIDCGHTFCSDCLNFSIDNKCVVCSSEIGPRRCVNVLIQELLEKWKEKNRHNEHINPIVPNPYILGVQPRYHLRSGYAGLQIKNETEDNMRKFIQGKKIEHEKIKRRKCPKINPDSFVMFLNNVLNRISNFKDNALKNSWDCIKPMDLECILCSRCFLDPVTTGCGHTFCRGCLIRVLDYGLSCPLCKSQLTVADYARGPTFVLNSAIQFLMPREYNDRMAVSLRETLVFKNSDVPVFVCTTAFPGVACPLIVYEPRYRLMVRRCLQSPTKFFAMVAKESNGQKFSSFGTILEIKDAVTLEDGRFILTTTGVRRFKVISKDEKDGYDTAKIQYIKDNDVPTDKLEELMVLHETIYKKAIKWIKSFKPKVLAEVERLIGQMPEVEPSWPSLPDGPAWTWWLMPLLPLSSQLQIGFLTTSSLDKRLRAIDKMLEHMKVRMKALERNVTCTEAEDSSSESCQYVLPFDDE